MGAQKGTEFTYILYFLNAKNRLRQAISCRSAENRASEVHEFIR
jgi:hypothetical protein